MGRERCIDGALSALYGYKGVIYQMDITCCNNRSTDLALEQNVGSGLIHTAL